MNAEIKCREWMQKGLPAKKKKLLDSECSEHEKVERIGVNNR